MFLEIVSVLCVLFGLFHFYITWNNSKWDRLNIPHKKPAFFFGNFKEALLLKKGFGVAYKDIYKEFPNEPFVGLHIFRDTSILIRDLDIVKQVLISNFQSFTNNDFEVNLKEDIIWATNPFGNNGERWKAVRTSWIPHLTQTKLKTSYSTLQKKIEGLVMKLNAEIIKNPKKDFNVKNLVSDFFLDFVMHALFGIETDSFEDSDNVFKQVKNRIFASSLRDALVINSFMIAPWLGKFIPIRMVSKEQEEKLLTSAREIIKLRKETGLPNTHIYETLQKYSEEDGKPYFSDVDIAGRIFGVLMDGSETASSPLTMGLYELACHQEMQQKLRDEINEAIQNGGGEITFEELHKLPYLEKVFSESLRLYLPLPVLSRYCTANTTLESNGKTVKVKKGEKVVIPAYAIHTDPQYYPNPYKFDPERFSEESIDKIPKNAFIPFGDGPRKCSGMRLGILECKMLLAMMVRHFHILPSVEVPRPIPMDPYAFVYKSPTDLKISLKAITM